jgi:hypothetical protein
MRMGTTVLFFGLGFSAALATLASIGLYLRQRRSTRKPVSQASGTESFAIACAGCGKHLKIKAALAGKKVKCPHCGTALVVPQPGSRGNAHPIVWAVGIPALLLLVVALLGVWAFWPISYLDTMLGHRWIPAIAETGFYEDENDAAGPFRWTNGRATMVIPLKNKDRPQSLLVQLDRPQDRWLQISVDHREVLKEQGGSRGEAIAWERTIDLSGLELGKEVIVEIASDTRPEPTEATRGELGVRVRGIKLLSQRGQEKLNLAASFVNVMLGNQPVGGVEESGFHEAERSKEGLFRWTKGTAKLVIPLHEKERPKAILVQLGWPRTRSVRVLLCGFCARRARFL